MTPESPDVPAGGSDAEGPSDQDMGAPVTELATIEWAPTRNLSRGIRLRIERRLLSGDMVELSWTAALVALLELLRAPFELFKGTRSN